MLAKGIISYYIYQPNRAGNTDVKCFFFFFFYPTYMYIDWEDARRLGEDAVKTVLYRLQYRIQGYKDIPMPLEDSKKTPPQAPPISTKRAHNTVHCQLTSRSQPDSLSTLHRFELLLMLHCPVLV